LLGNACWIFHFLEVLLLQFFSKSFIILCHLLLLQLFPLKFNFFLQLFLLFFSFYLDLLLSNDITHQHFTVQSLYHILIIMENLLSFIKLPLTWFLLKDLLLSIKFPPSNLIIFQLLNTFVLFPFPLSLNCIWPLGNSGEWLVMQLISFWLSHCLIILFFVGIWAHALYSLNFIYAKDYCVLCFKGFLFFVGVGLVLRSYNFLTGHI